MLLIVVVVGYRRKFINDENFPIYRGVGASNFNGRTCSDPDIVSGSLPYLECVSTKLVL